ncbi:hypothetical protein A3K34_04605 [candidate division WWE3 bacterium RIFOXYC1_FULL_40_10]|uniref:Uncharacterized protein n=1 Tax=candidate division WWE3 bacterium RIFOXYA2_FULL_46_9 TaxID=1802636 RepID=A0A1F4W1B1_UNCKA|nr:MAG: hypothetical protein A3K58_04605 [candidate division WWE3 bacterium RIFOXYB1_FULL_40_22]OGC62122.1 MAG: hypothetical protein A3K37_04605 [candidate division WWE3 bacterium RIFOXYA1_FULL_40_11]OGC63135.1 MAG: hypothetical protein A2264_00350 [candidate division WWE3 bacterium RIFOXYA2_FULL_46_9]OGC64935.1 MAG: hypothetical protein A2326_02760 [candidate division WWE3 bacterium RIFOXYB2_FULL_41_6]OGC66505.1 MAG: hypothetical protein A3K34_04605 [candidate division WWE3 bacterium RIFOXYC1_
MNENKRAISDFCTAVVLTIAVVLLFLGKFIPTPAEVVLRIVEVICAGIGSILLFQLKKNSQAMFLAMVVAISFTTMLLTLTIQ